MQISPKLEVYRVYRANQDQIRNQRPRLRRNTLILGRKAGGGGFSPVVPKNLIKMGYSKDAARPKACGNEVAGPASTYPRRHSLFHWKGWMFKLQRKRNDNWKVNNYKSNDMHKTRKINTIPRNSWSRSIILSCAPFIHLN